jgi:hypothetical protein
MDVILSILCRGVISRDELMIDGMMRLRTGSRMVEIEIEWALRIVDLLDYL